MQQRDYRMPLRNRAGEVVAYTVVDPWDYWWAGNATWYLNAKYVVRSVRGEKRLLHREIMKPPPGYVVDHINRDRLDNRRANLRIVTQAQNCQNYPAYRENLGHRGVYWNESAGKWQATVRIDGRLKSFGYFNTEQEAADAARAGRLEHFTHAHD